MINWAIDEIKIVSDGKEEKGFKISCAYNAVSFVVNEIIFLELVNLINLNQKKSQNWQITEIDDMTCLYSAYNFVDMLLPKDIYQELVKKLKGELKLGRKN